MAQNHYTTNKFLQEHVDHFIDWKRIHSAYKSEHSEETVEVYKELLSQFGKLCGEGNPTTGVESFEQRAGKIDKSGGAKLIFEKGKNKCVWAEGTQESFAELKEAGLLAISAPEEYGGPSLPVTLEYITADLIGRADSSLVTLGLLQSLANTIDDIGSEELKKKYIPEIVEGNITCAMALTEDKAGSDIGNTETKAYQKYGKWFIQGKKKFITNGWGTDIIRKGDKTYSPGHISLLLARTDEESKGNKGLSLFIVPRDDKTELISNENKFGIKGSPTCELQYNDAPAELLGELGNGFREMEEYILTGARLGVSAQAVGTAEAAFQYALNYANKRVQFKKPIIDFPAIQEKLLDMRVRIEAGRSLVLKTAEYYDVRRGLEKQLRSGASEELENELKKTKDIIRCLSSFAKMYCAEEVGEKVTREAMQVMGGNGYMKDYPLERYYRDGRIISVYEGTTEIHQLLTLKSLAKGSIMTLQQELEQILSQVSTPLKLDVATAMNIAQEALQEFAQHSMKDRNCALVYQKQVSEMLTDLTIGTLFVSQAQKLESREALAEYFLKRMVPRVVQNSYFISSGDVSVLEQFNKIL